MKRFLNLFLSLAVLLATVLSLTACSLGGGEYKAMYKKQSITLGGVSSMIESINDKTLSDASYSKYEATYKSDYENDAYDFTTKYEVKMKVNGEANVGEVLAYIELKSFYEQSDGLHGRDILIKYCIVRVTDGNTYNDYKIYMNIGEETYSGTFNEVIDYIDQEDVYFPGNPSNLEASNILDYEPTQGDYYQTLYSFALAVTGQDAVSTLDNPIIFCLHAFNKGNFLDTMRDLNESSTSDGWTLYSAGDSAYKITRKYSDKRFFLEECKSTAFLKIHNDGTYSHKLVYEYKTENPARAHETKTERELKPLSGVIEIPSWAR